MSNGIPTRHPDPLRGGPDDDLAAYIRAEQMLDRYGVAYVCQHPEILVGIVPPVDSAYGARAIGQGYRRNGRDRYLGTFARGRPNDAEDMLSRAIDAYQALDELLFQHRPMAVAQHPPMGDSYDCVEDNGPSWKPTRYTRNV